MNELRVVLACGTALTSAFASLVLAGCLGGNAAPSYGGDADADADADSDGDADADSGPATGRVLGEQVGDTRPLLAGVQVALLDAAGDPIDEARTDANGEYELAGLPADAAFIVAQPTEGYLGQLRSTGIREGTRFYDLTLQSETGIDGIQQQVGLTRDPAAALVVVGFNPVNREAGGEGATLDPANHDAPFTLVDDGAVSGNVLQPICPPAGGGDPDCVQGNRGDFVFFPNVEPGLETVRLVQPRGGMCALRFDVDRWPTVAGVSTIIEVDCQAR